MYLDSCSSRWKWFDRGISRYCQGDCSWSRKHESGGALQVFFSRNSCQSLRFSSFDLKCQGPRICPASRQWWRSCSDRWFFPFENSERKEVSDEVDLPLSVMTKRYIIRLQPVEATCFAKLEDISEVQTNSLAHFDSLRWRRRSFDQEWIRNPLNRQLWLLNGFTSCSSIQFSFAPEATISLAEMMSFPRSHAGISLVFPVSRNNWQRGPKTQSRLKKSRDKHSCRGVAG